MNDGQVGAEMPRYKCHKQVWALKIKEVNSVWREGSDVAVHFLRTLVPEDATYAPFEVSAEYIVKHAPKAGGYYVVYDDGYKSYSPAAAFEAGYSLIV